MTAGDPSSESLQEVDRVGLLEAVPDTALAVVADYLVTDSGQIFVSDPQYSRILILDRDTGNWKTVGRKGQGPGEFLLPDRLNVVGDSLLVWDRLNERMSYYTRGGDFLSIVRPSPGISQIFEVTPTPGGGLVVPTWGLGREHLITWSSASLQRPPTSHRQGEGTGPEVAP